MRTMIKMTAMALMLALGMTAIAPSFVSEAQARHYWWHH
jgi:hypothetical protein